MKLLEALKNKLDQWFPYDVCTVYSGRMFATLRSDGQVVYGDRHFRRVCPLSACSDELIDEFNEKLDEEHQIQKPAGETTAA